MKRLLVLLILNAPLFSNSQVLEGVWGIKFGMPLNDAKLYANKKSSSTPKVSNEGNILTYNDCDFGGRKAAVMRLLFYQGKFYGADIYFVPNKEPDILSLYNNIKTDIEIKYFTAGTSVESYKYPYEKEDKHFLTAIKGGYTTIGAIWNFPKGSADNETGQIMIIIDPEVWVKVAYRDAEISKLLQENIKKRDQDDF